MRAVLTVGHGERDRLQLDENFPDPQAARDEVVLRVAATAVNYHDIFTRRSMPGIRIPLPVIVGSDIAGEVVAVGADGHAWKPGDRGLGDQIGRASCRERGEISVVAVSLKKKKRKAA